MRLLRVAAAVAAVALDHRSRRRRGARAPAPNARTGCTATSCRPRTSRTAPIPGDYGNYDLANRPDDGLARPLRRDPRHRGRATTTRSRRSRTRTPTSARTTSRARPTASSRRWCRRTTSRGRPATGGSTRTPSGSRTRASRSTRRTSRAALPLARAADALHGRALRHPARPRAHHRPRPGARARRPPSRRGCTGIRARTSTGRTSWRSSARRSRRRARDKTGRIVTIDPNFETNRPPVSACDGSGAAPAAVAARELPLPAHGAERVRAVRRRSVPRRAWERRARRTGATRPSPASRSRSPSARATGSRSGTAAQKAWLYDPKGKNTVPGGGTLVTPKAGLASIPVYGRAYPSSVSTATLGYTIPAGQTYVAKDLVGADYYSASTFNAPETYSVVTERRAVLRDLVQPPHRVRQGDGRRHCELMAAGVRGAGSLSRQVKIDSL